MRVPVQWDTRREPRKWTEEEFEIRLAHSPEKIEFVNGIFASDRERHAVLGMLLENLGIDAVVRLGRIEDWQAAVAARRAAPKCSENPEDKVRNPASGWHGQVLLPVSWNRHHGQEYLPMPPIGGQHRAG